MRRALIVISLSVLVMVMAGAASPAFADVAPPQNPPGATIKSGHPDTKVQMVSEAVVMTISDYQPTEEQKQKFAAPFMQGHVDATFQMQNQGDAAESFDVWFPLGADTGMGYVQNVDNFTAYVDGVQAASIGQQMTKGQFDQDVPWATWPAAFPPGQQVTIRVTYDTYPTGYSPYGRFEYVLETGAGWDGPIGDGTVTIRLPYAATEENVALTGGQDYYKPQGGKPTLSGTDVVWHFTNLEPTADNNIGLTVLSPAVWNGILAAQSAADASPNSAKAQLDLGNALYKALEWKYELLDIGDSVQLRDKATAAYEKALTLDPNNVDVYTGYLQLLQSENSVFGLPDPRFAQILDRALQLAPDNQQLQEMKQNQLLNLTQMAAAGTVVAPPPTLTPAPSQAAATPTSAAVADVTTVQAPTPVPNLAATGVPATDVPSPAASTGSVGVILALVVVGIVAIGVALAGGIWLGRRSKGG